jgi:hypothetical protein
MARPATRVMTADDPDDDEVMTDLNEETIDLPAGLSDRDGRQPAQTQPQEEELTFVDDGEQQPEREASLAEPEEPVQQTEPQSREPRRRTRAERNAASKAWQTRIERENRELKSQIAELHERTVAFEPRLSEIDQSQRGAALREIDRGIEVANSRVVNAELRLKDAIASGDGELHVAALRERDAAQRALFQFENDKQRVQAVQPRPQQFQPQPNLQAQFQAPLPSNVQARVNEFQAENPWYNPDGRDIDSRIILDIDREVAAEGFLPNTDDYWDEIRDRAARYMPHRFAAEEPTPQARPQERRPMPAPRQQIAPERRGPAVAGGGQRPSTPNPNHVRMIPGRKEILIEVGALLPDGRTPADKQKLQRYLKQFRDYDLENPAA